jgi:hypothetical protein
LKYFYFKLGFYIDPKEAIRSRLEIFLNKLTEAEISDLKTIMIKVSADGTNLCRNVKVANVVFNFINEKLKAATAAGCYRIGIFEIECENYESTKEWLPLIWNQVKSCSQMHYDKIDRKLLNTSTCTPANSAQSATSTASVFLTSQEPQSTSMTSISNLHDTERYTKIKIEHIFCADYKMELLVLGMYAASGNWPCIYCTQHKDKLHLKGIFVSQDKI